MNSPEQIGEFSTHEKPERSEVSQEAIAEGDKVIVDTLEEIRSFANQHKDAEDISAINATLDRFLDKKEIVEDILKESDNLQPLNDLWNKQMPEEIKGKGKRKEWTQWREQHPGPSQRIEQLQLVASLVRGARWPNIHKQWIEALEAKVLEEEYQTSAMKAVARAYMNYGMVAEFRDALDKTYEIGKEEYARQGYNYEREVTHGLSHLIVFSVHGGKEQERLIPSSLFKTRLKCYEILYNKIIDEWYNAPEKSNLIDRFISAFPAIQQVAKEKGYEVKPEDFGITRQLFDEFIKAAKGEMRGDDEYFSKSMTRAAKETAPILGLQEKDVRSLIEDVEAKEGDIPKEMVLVVEDNIGAAEKMKETLTEMGHIVDVAESLSDARSKFSDWTYDRVFLDMEFPERPGQPQSRDAGKKLAQEIGTEHPELVGKIVLTSDLNFSQEELNELERLGFASAIKNDTKQVIRLGKSDEGLRDFYKNLPKAELE